MIQIKNVTVFMAIFKLAKKPTACSTHEIFELPMYIIIIIIEGPLNM